MGDDDADVRKQFLSRIENIDKGRFAGHLAVADLTRLPDVLDPAHRTGYLFQALDQASRITRGRPLLDHPVEDETDDHCESTP